MSIDVFGRTLIKTKEVYQSPAGIGFSLTKDGDFNIEKYGPCNVAPAIDPPTRGCELRQFNACRGKFE